MKEDTLIYGDIEMNITFPCVKIKEKEVGISKMRFRVLRQFLQLPERTLTRDILKSNVWENSFFMHERTIDIMIKEVKKILLINQSDCEIIAIRGMGYRLKLKK